MYAVMQATIDRIRAAVDKHNLEVKSNEVKVNVRRKSSKKLLKRQKSQVGLSTEV